MLEGTRWPEVKDLFHAALELSQEDREQLLATSANRDTALVEEVRSLLRSHERAESFLAATPAQLKSPLQSHPELCLGDSIGDFVLLRLLGEGAAGQVYLAQQRSLDRKVALKITPSFGHEARTLAHLDHDHIVKVYSEAFWDERYSHLICMQYIAGPSLEELMKAYDRRCDMDPLALVPTLSFDAGVLGSTQRAEFESLSRFEKCEYLLWFSARLAEALDYAHQRGILHLDVKPANVLVGPSGRPMLTDFNVSVSQQALEQKTPEVFGGTLQYMSPEHRDAFEKAKRREKLPSLDARSDIYSLGVVIKEIFSRFECLETNAKIDFHDLKKEVTRIVAKCMATGVRERYQSAWELSKDLESCLELRRISKAMPQKSWLLRKAMERPFLTLSVSALIPQLLADVLNLTYNATRTVISLSFEQQKVFQALTLSYNLGFVPIVLYLFVKRFAPIRDMVKRWDSPTLTLTQQKEMRTRILDLPRVAILLTSLGWVPACFYFPFGIHLIKGPVSLDVFSHFLVAFLLSWWIALAYSYLYLEFVAIRIFYPHLWRGQLRIDRLATAELEGISRRFEGFQLLAVGTPLVGVALGLGMDAAPKAILLALLALGLFGAFHSIRVSRMLSQTISAFTQNS
jgi:serine/threonine protein kinase